MYGFTDYFQAGLEYNPLAEDADGRLGPLANWRAVPEKGWRPALILGTSSDRIGTPEGQAFYATLSKSLEPQTGMPLAPYIGLSYGTWEDRLDPIGGLNIFWPGGVSTTHLFDGVNLHHLLNVRATDRLSAGLMLVFQKDERDAPYVGVTLGFRF